MADVDAVVIGAGLAGLSAACHLRGQGRSVVVVEATGGPGGLAGVAQDSGYTFDTGPTVLTMPSIIEECFTALGAEMSAHLELHPVDPMYRGCFADGSEIRVRQGVDAMAQEIAATCGPREAAAFAPFVDWLTELYQLEMPNFIDRNMESPLTIARPLAPAVQLVRSGAFRRLEPAVRRYFTDERLVRLFSFQALYAGLAPQQALAVYAVITYMDTVNGVFRATGGMHAVPSALARAAATAGVKFEYNAPVVALERDASTGAVRGVRTSGGVTISADAVVCTADMSSAYRRLLPDLAAPRRLERGHFSPSALVWHLGVRGDLPHGAEHHNIHFGADWDGAFTALLERGERMPDPSVLVSVPTVHEPGMAPPGGHVLYVLEPVPNLGAPIDWRREREPARQRLLEMLDRNGYPTDIQTEMLVDPTDWRARGLERGTPFSLSHRFFQSGPFRPRNTDARVPGLVFAGAGTVPGVGIPMVLTSGKLAAQRVAERVGER